MIAAIIERLRLYKNMTREHRAIIYGLKAGQIAIDCGANVGVVSRAMASNGADVYAFEPNPYAYAECLKRCAKYSTVHLMPKAVGNENGKVNLYLHKEAASDQVAFSQGSSVLKTKLNVNPDDYREVDVIDLAAFVKSIGQRINLLKMDIEGFEVEVIPNLIQSGAIDLIDLCFVELHERKAPELLEKTNTLRALITAKNLDHKFVLDWH